MSKEAFNEAIAYVRALDEQDRQAITAADALAAAVEQAERDACDGWHEGLAEALAEYRKIRPQSAPDGSETAKGQ